MESLLDIISLTERSQYLLIVPFMHMLTPQVFKLLWDIIFKHKPA